VFVSWAKLRRADTIAEKLGIESITVRWLHGRKSLLLAAARYAIQWLHTILLLAWRRPRVVFVTSPPIFAASAVHLYALVFRARFVIDFHSGCFIEEHWRRWDRLQRFLARRAALNLVHNRDNARAIEAWGAPHVVLPSIPPAIEAPAAAGEAPSRGRPLAVYICSFKVDEPVDALLEAARGLPDVDFAVSGRAPPDIAPRLPGNVRLTGFLGEEEYNRLLAGADVIIALTTRTDTLLYGAQEAIALHKPLVLSRTPTLEAYFPDGTVFAENAPDALREAVREALRRKEDLRARMAAFEARFRAEGAARIEDIKARLGLSP
jgi:glycosyltransferase involved in cell wall biosynthesis